MRLLQPARSTNNIFTPSFPAAEVSAGEVHKPAASHSSRRPTERQHFKILTKIPADLQIADRRPPNRTHVYTYTQTMGNKCSKACCADWPSASKNFGKPDATVHPPDSLNLRGFIISDTGIVSL